MRKNDQLSKANYLRGNNRKKKVVKFITKPDCSLNCPTVAKLKVRIWDLIGEVDRMETARDIERMRRAQDRIYWPEKPKIIDREEGC